MVATNETVVAVWCDTREASESDGDTEIYFVAIPYLEVLEHLYLLDISIEPETDEDVEA